MQTLRRLPNVIIPTANQDAAKAHLLLSDVSEMIQGMGKAACTGEERQVGICRGSCCRSQQPGQLQSQVL